MPDIIIATKNKGKIREFKFLLSNYFDNIFSLLDLDNAPDIVEDRDSFEGNALKKAATISSHFKKCAIADDSGLVVEALNGEPGIYSARYAGENATDDDNTDKLLDKMEGIRKRDAKFICVLAIVCPDGKKEIFRGECKGEIPQNKKGTNGFGYDPVFYLTQYNKTMAELSEELKNEISHRSNAAKKLINFLKNS